MSKFQQVCECERFYVYSQVLVSMYLYETAILFLEFIFHLLITRYLF